MSKRMKKVFSNQQELAHVWASQSQGEGRSSSMFFEETSIYSYGLHYCIAKMHTARDANVVLINSKGYSISTAKHTNYVSRAVSHLKTFYVPEVNSPKSEENLRHLRNGIADQVTRLMFCRDVVGDNYEVKQILDAVKEYNDFCWTFNISDKLELPEDFLTEIQAVHSAKRAAMAPRLEAKKLREAEEQLKRQAEFEQSVQDWLEFKGLIKGYSDRVYIRVNNETGEVETSQGARVPLDEAKKLAALLLKGPTLNEAMALVGSKIGHYTIDELNDNEIIIGCHNIPLTEVTRVFA